MIAARLKNSRERQQQVWAKHALETVTALMEKEQDHQSQETAQDPWETANESCKRRLVNLQRLSQILKHIVDDNPPPPPKEELLGAPCHGVMVNPNSLRVHYRDSCWWFDGLHEGPITLGVFDLGHVNAWIIPARLRVEANLRALQDKRQRPSSATMHVLQKLGEILDQMLHDQHEPRIHEMVHAEGIRVGKAVFNLEGTVHHWVRNKSNGGGKSNNGKSSTSIPTKATELSTTVPSTTTATRSITGSDGDPQDRDSESSTAKNANIPANNNTIRAEKYPTSRRGAIPEKMLNQDCGGGGSVTKPSTISGPGSPSCFGNEDSASSPNNEDSFEDEYGTPLANRSSPCSVSDLVDSFDFVNDFSVDTSFEVVDPDDGSDIDDEDAVLVSL